MTSNYSIIEKKLNDFIRKFYSNRIVIGIIFFILIAILSLFCVFFIESLAFMQPSVKTILFYFLIFLFSSVFIFFILIPSCKLLRIIPFLSYQEAANIIQNYFSEPKDLLTNILQLHTNEESDLLAAAINQKIEVISPLNFSNAINYKKTAKFLAYSLSIAAFLVILSFVFRKNIKEGAVRFMNYSTFYQPENPYSLSVLNDSLVCAYGDDFTLNVKITGPNAISDVFIKNNQLNFRMKNDSAGYYSYIFKNMNSDLSFSLNYLGFSSENYSISVYHKPSMFVSRVTVVPPSYTKLESEELNNLSDFTVPFGSTVTWNFEVLNSDSFTFVSDSIQTVCEIDDQVAKFSKTALKPFDYNYFALGEKGICTSSAMFHVNLVPDYSPQIVAVSAVDSSAANSLFFNGRISDDYGFHSLTFNYFDSDKPSDVNSIELNLVPNIIQDFNFYFDFSNMSKSVSYYFEVRDNDPISGFKSARTPLSVYTSITNEEKQQRVDNLNNSILDKIDETKRLISELNNEMNDFLKNVSSNNQISDYEKQLKIDNIMQKRDKLNDLLEQLNQDNLSKNAFENQLSQNMDNDLKESQQKIQQMWQDLLSDDLQKLLDKINEMAISLSERDLRMNIQDMKFDFNQISEQIDRNSELMKMYNVENKIQNLSKDLKEMSKEYKDLSKELKENSIKDTKSDSKSKSISENRDNKKDVSDYQNKSMSQKIDDFENKFQDKISKYEELLKLNDELDDKKLSINDVKKQFEDIKLDLEYQKNEMMKLDNELGNKVPESKFDVDKNSESQKSDNASRENISNKPDDSQNSYSKSSENLSQTPSETENNSNFDSQKQDFSDNNSRKSDDNIQNSSLKDSRNDSQKTDGDEKSRENDSQKIENSKESQGGNSNNPEQNHQNRGQQNQLSQPINDSQKQRQQNISNQMQQSSDEIQQLSESVAGNKKSNEKKQHAENLSDVRQILDNLVTLSFNQESAINKLKTGKSHDLSIIDVLDIQNTLSKDFQIVQDSIYALAKRTPKLGHAVYKKINDIHSFGNKIVNFLNDGNRGMAINNQQYLLTNLNDLSLIFSEIQDDMQKQLDQSGDESEEEKESVETRNRKQNQQRQKSTQQMKSQQQKLQEMLQKMLQQIREGGEPSSQELAQSLRLQEMMMQKLQEMMNGQGLSTQEQHLMNQIHMLMDENRRDIVNRNISPRTVDRHKTVFNKLLDLEKAEKSQDFEQERESKQGSEIQPQNIDELNLKFKDFGTKEYLHLSPINLNLFYQNLYNEYIQNIE